MSTALRIAEKQDGHPEDRKRCSRRAAAPLGRQGQPCVAIGETPAAGHRPRTRPRRSRTAAAGRSGVRARRQHSGCSSTLFPHRRGLGKLFTSSAGTFLLSLQLNIFLWESARCEVIDGHVRLSSENREDGPCAACLHGVGGRAQRRPARRATHAPAPGPLVVTSDVRKPPQ